MRCCPYKLNRRHLNWLSGLGHRDTHGCSARPHSVTSSYSITTVAVLFGLLEWEHYRALLAASLLFGISTTLAAVFLSDVATGRYLRSWDLALLLGAAILENVGYRQMNAWWGCVGTVQALTGKGSWGQMTRRPFQGPRF